MATALFYICLYRLKCHNVKFLSCMAFVPTVDGGSTEIRRTTTYACTAHHKCTYETKLLLAHLLLWINFTTGSAFYSDVVWLTDSTGILANVAFKALWFSRPFSLTFHLLCEWLKLHFCFVQLCRHSVQVMLQVHFDFSNSLVSCSNDSHTH